MENPGGRSLHVRGRRNKGRNNGGGRATCPAAIILAAFTTVQPQQRKQTTESALGSAADRKRCRSERERIFAGRRTSDTRMDFRPTPFDGPEVGIGPGSRATFVLVRRLFCFFFFFRLKVRFAFDANFEFCFRSLGFFVSLLPFGGEETRCNGADKYLQAVLS